MKLAAPAHSRVISGWGAGQLQAGPIQFMQLMSCKISNYCRVLKILKIKLMKNLQKQCDDDDDDDDDDNDKSWEPCLVPGGDQTGVNLNGATAQCTPIRLCVT